MAIAERWDSFFNELFQLKNSLIRDKNGMILKGKYLELVKAQTNRGKELIELIRLQLLPYLLPPSFTATTGSTEKKTKRARKISLMESKEGFLVHAKVRTFRLL